MKQSLPITRGTQSDKPRQAQDATLFVGVKPDCGGMSRLADALKAQAFLPDRIALQEILNSAHRPVSIVLPVSTPTLVLLASRHRRVHRLAVYFSPSARVSPWKRALMRAVFALADQTIIQSSDSLIEAVRAGADPDRIIVGFDDLSSRLHEETPRREMKEAMVSLGLDAADSMGLIGLLQKLSPDQGVNVVNYHRILPTAEHRRYPRPQMAMAAPLFEIQLEAFAHSGGFVSLNELRRADRKGRIAITFDDGYEDNHRVALESLTRWSVPACIYLVTQQIDQEHPLWWDQVGQALHSLWRDGNKKALHDERLPTQAQELASTGSPLRARHLISEILGRLNDATPKERESLQHVLRTLGSPAGEKTMLSWAQIQTMSKAGIQFGSHTQNHLCLDELSQEQARREVMLGQADLENALGAAAEKSVALPRGKLGPFTEASLQEAGFNSVMTTIPGVNRANDDSLFVLRRDGKMLTLKGRHHPAKLKLELTGWVDRIRNMRS